VAAISLPAGQVDQARAVAREIVSELRASLLSGAPQQV
jgi:hypothetical protein